MRATRLIREGEPVLEYGGKLVTRAEARRLERQREAECKAASDGRDGGASYMTQFQVSVPARSNPRYFL